MAHPGECCPEPARSQDLSPSENSQRSDAGALLTPDQKRTVASSPSQVSHPDSMAFGLRVHCLGQGAPQQFNDSAIAPFSCDYQGGFTRPADCSGIGATIEQRSRDSDVTATCRKQQRLQPQLACTFTSAPKSNNA